MTAIVRETWIIIGFVVLAVAALVVSAAGWILLFRGRRDARRAVGSARAVGEDEAPAPSGP